MVVDMPSPDRQRVALVVIARNEARHIQRLLASARPWVDEALVLDTGSSDDTVRLARAAGARVEQFRWVDDFSAARNAALALSRADWHLVLDADEWIVSGGEALLALRHQSPCFVGQLRVDSQQRLGNAATPCTTSTSWLSRVLPAAVRYAGRVHEQPVHELPVCQLPVVIGHDGYLPEALATKVGRNARLLQQAVNEHPDDAYLWYQLGKDHDVYERHRDALACLDHAEALIARQAPASAPAWVHDLTVRRLHALKRCDRHAQAVQQAEESMARWSHSPDFFFTLGDVLLDWAADQPHRAAELMPVMEAAWQRCLDLGERPDLEGAVAGRGSHLAAHNLALLYEVLKRPAEAARYRELARPRSPSAPAAPPSAPAAQAVRPAAADRRPTRV